MKSFLKKLNINLFRSKKRDEKSSELVRKRMFHRKFGSGIIIEDRFGDCRQGEVMFRLDDFYPYPAENNDKYAGWTKLEKEDIVLIKDLEEEILV